MTLTLGVTHNFLRFVAALHLRINVQLYIFTCTIPRIHHHPGRMRRQPSTLPSSGFSIKCSIVCCLWWRCLFVEDLCIHECRWPEPLLAPRPIFSRMCLFHKPTRRRFRISRLRLRVAGPFTPLQPFLVLEIKGKAFDHVCSLFGSRRDHILDLLALFVGRRLHDGARRREAGLVLFVRIEFAVRFGVQGEPSVNSAAYRVCSH